MGEEEKIVSIPEFEDRLQKGFIKAGVELYAHYEDRCRGEGLLSLLTNLINILEKVTGQKVRT